MLSQILEEKIWTGSHLPAHKSSQQDGIQRHAHHGVRTIKISNRHVIPVSMLLFHAKKINTKYL